MFKKTIYLCLFLLLFTCMVNITVISTAGSTADYVKRYNDNYTEYLEHDKAIADAFLAEYNNSEAQALVARAIWYMENGYMIYGHSKYWDTGYIDCSNFVSLVYKDFGYEITSASKNYTQVGEKIEGVYSRKISGSSKYELVGVEKLRPGDIFTYWKEDSDGSGTHIGHVALYMGVINGKPTIIQTNSDRPTAIGIRTDFRYWYGEHFSGARRVLDDASQYPGKEWQASLPVIPAKYQLPPQKPIVMPESKFMSYNAADNPEDTIEENEQIIEEQLPEEQMPEEQMPDEQMPEEIIPDEQMPDGQIVEDQTPEDQKPDHTGSDIINTGEIPREFANDIAGHWAEQNINKVFTNEIISGYPDGSFRPDNVISRAEFVTILVKAFKLDQAEGKEFSDTVSHWAADYISTAEAYGIINGYNNGYNDERFGPDDVLNREQMAVMIVKALELELPAEGNPAEIFEDDYQISDWAKNSILAANRENIINGFPDGAFKPRENARRSEAVTVIVNALGL